MEPIFAKPLLASEEYVAGEQTFTLYELPGDIYNRYILSPEALRAWDHLMAKQAAENAEAGQDAEEPQQETEPEEPDYQALYDGRLEGTDGEYLWVACSLYPGPGCEGFTVEQICDALKRNITLETLGEMFEVVARLNKLTAPKADTPKHDSSTD